MVVHSLKVLARYFNVIGDLGFSTNGFGKRMFTRSKLRFLMRIPIVLNILYDRYAAMWKASLCLDSVLRCHKMCQEERKRNE
jgi:hypothetical protein